MSVCIRKWNHVGGHAINGRREMHGHAVCNQREQTANLAVTNGTTTHRGEEKREFINNFF